MGDVIRGLSSQPKSLSPKYCYDAVGSGFFDEIAALDEYYLTRTELAIVDSLASIRLDAKEGLAVIELGGASSFKFRRLMSHLEDLRMYVPVDISRDVLFASAAQLASDFPQLKVTALCADYQQLATFPWNDHLGKQRRMVFFPGSTLGNLAPGDAELLLRMCRTVTGDQGTMLLGCDLLKDLKIILPAYDDSKGANARFNLNVLTRINQELGGDFDLAAFRHQVRFNQDKGQIEIHLVTTKEQLVHIGGQTFHFAAGEGIFAETSRKFVRADLEAMAKASGFAVQEWWTDAQGGFALVLLRAI
jgi:dimethylhistidine N-methyltransferase